MIRLASIAAVVLASFALPASAQVFKCTDKAGKTIYQDGPCDGSIVRPAPSPPASKSPASPEVAPPQVDGMVVQLVYAYVSCTRLFPDLHAKTAMSYQAWRLKNAAAVSRLEAHPEFQADLKRRTDKSVEELQRQPEMRAQGHANCSAMLSAFDPTPRAPEMPANVANSPTEAWNGYLAAVNAGDIQKALGYLMPGSRDRYRPVLEALGPDGLRKSAATFGDLKTDAQVTGDLALGYLTRKMPDGTTHAFEISFMRDPRSGGWFIASM